jgi:hypothetical protein
MSRLICAVFGHKWKTVFIGNKSGTCMVCLRCRENGWRL